MSLSVSTMSILPSRQDMIRKGSSTPTVHARQPVHRTFRGAVDILTVHVGPEATVFRVHQSIICSSSKFFEARMKPEWSRTSDAHVELLDHTPEAFNIYTNWLYNGGIPDLSSIEDSTKGKVQERDWLALASVYALGEALMDVEFKDAVSDAVRTKLRGPDGNTIWTAVGDMITFIYDRTPPGSGMRLLLVDLFAWHAESILVPTIMELPNEFVTELLHAYTTSRSTLKLADFGVSERDQCAYHCHQKDTDCSFLSWSPTTDRLLGE